MISKAAVDATIAEAGDLPEGPVCRDWVLATESALGLARGELPGGDSVDPTHEAAWTLVAALHRGDPDPVAAVLPHVLPAPLSGEDPAGWWRAHLRLPTAWRRRPWERALGAAWPGDEEHRRIAAAVRAWLSV